MSVKIAVVGVFTSFPQAEKALNILESKRLANSKISVVRKLPDRFLEETAWELYPMEKLDGILVSFGTIKLPEIGQVAAGGPLAGILKKQPEEGIKRALIHYGISETEADFYSRQVTRGRTLVLIETNKEKANHLANVLEESGADYIEKWNKNLDKPFHPFH